MAVRVVGPGAGSEVRFSSTARMHRSGNYVYWTFYADAGQADPLYQLRVSHTGTLARRYREDGAWGSWESTTLNVTGSRAANAVYAAPNGSDGAASFRKLVAADIPNLAASKITSGTLGAARIPIIDNNVLWSGAYYMTADHTATLSQAVSAQRNGIALVFSAFSSDKAQDYDFVTYPVPKGQVAAHPGGGVCVPLAKQSLSTVGAKYLYVHDKKITGHSSNASAGTAASGVKYANNYWVLRAVYGF